MTPASLERAEVACGPALLVVTNDGMAPAERLVTQLAARWPTTVLIVVSAEQDHALITRSLRAGADDWISPETPTELVRARLDAIRRRVEQEGQETRMVLGDLTIDRRRRRICRDDVTLAITGREFVLLEALISGGGAPVRRSDLLEWAWGNDEAELPSENALEVYISYLRRKLAAGRIEILTVRGVGYRLVVRPAPPITP